MADFGYAKAELVLSRRTADPASTSSQGAPVTGSRTCSSDRFDADIENLWSALTDPGRLARWMGEAEGDLRLGGEFRARFFASGWEGTGRVEACEPPRQLLLLTTQPGQSREHFIEVTLATDGAQTSVVWEERGILRASSLPTGRGSRCMFEDLAAYLAGRERCDADARWNELLPAYEDLASNVG